MNVEQGDIARLVGLPPRAAVNNNRLVSVLHPCVCDEHRVFDSYGPRWCCEALQTLVDTLHDRALPAGTVDCVPDRYLRRLHDGAGQDEMLRITGLPEQHETPIGVINSVLRDLGFERVWP